MNQFIKVFVVSLIIFTLVIATGMFSYAKFFNPEPPITDTSGGDLNPDNNNGDDDIDDNATPLERAMKRSKRINVLLLGLEGSRSDTIMIASYDRLNKKANIISVPRDTYYYREGYTKYSEFQKINAVYGSEEGRAVAVMDAVEELTGIPIDKYVSVDYDAVRAAVDALGGVEFDVPFHMKYTDIYDKPPLRIDIKPGVQTIYGDKAMEFLRFRKGDPGYPGYPEGDVGRVKTQQQFVKAAIDKALSLKLPSVISAIYPYVKTNFSLSELLGLAGDAVGFSTANLEMEILPGYSPGTSSTGGLSFFMVDQAETRKLVYELYGLHLPSDNEDEVSPEAEE